MPLWGIVTNGLTLRLLRDSTYIRRQAYVEFNLAAILEEQHFQDFAVLYRLLHRTRLPRTAKDASQCFLEQYYQHSVEQGGRVRERLRDGVEECLKRLANGFLAHPDNQDLRRRALPGCADPDRLEPRELYRQLLRLVYRFLFLLVSEDQGLISPDPLYREHYGVGRLRRLLDNRSAYNDYEDLWYSLRVLWKVLSDEKLANLLQAAPLNGELFAELDLDRYTITNRDLLEGFWYLVYYQESGVRPYAPTLRRVNYAALDVEELGSVYESLLELHPVIDASDPSRPRFDFATGTERKSTGSYYTPPELVAELIRSALEPVILDRLASSERRAASSEASELTLEEKRYVYQLLSRSSGLAKQHGSGRATSIPANIAEGWGATNDRGIPAVPSQLPGQPARTGDPPLIGSPSEASQQRSDSTPFRFVPGNRAPVDQLSAQPFNEKRFLKLWQSLPLTTRRSLLAEHAILSVRVLDPACGSGHFLLAAARRLGKELARIRTGEDEPAPERVREAIRDVVAHCIYGVDKNPLAVELCRVTLWLEAHCEGKPLTFLDHHIRCGDSLVGVFDLDVLTQGIPDEAFQPVSGDDRQWASSLKRQNRRERQGQRTFFAAFDAASEVRTLSSEAEALDAIRDDSPQSVRKKQRLFNELQQKSAHDRTACNLWTAAFFQPLRSGQPVITSEHLADYLEGRPIDGRILGLAEATASAQRFFHWPLEFPEVFEKRAASSQQRAVSSEQQAASSEKNLPLAESGGFDVVLSNPPWERIKLQEEEFFASRDREIANAPTAAARKQLIQQLPGRNPKLWQEYQKALHATKSTSRFLRGGGRYPLTGRGDINTYAVFAELTRWLLKPQGRAGIIVPTGIATDATTQHFFQDLVMRHSLVSLYDFENRKKLFPAVDSRMKFCLLTLRGTSASGEWRVASRQEQPTTTYHSPLTTYHSPIEFAFFCHEARDLQDAERRFTLAPEDFHLLNPNTRTAPIFRSRRDAELTKHIYRRVPVLMDEAKGEAGNLWGVSFLRLFDMANDSHLFRTRAQLEAEGFRLEGNIFVQGEGRTAVRPYLPLYEAKMVHQFHHRFGDYRDHPPGSASTQLPDVPPERLADPDYLVLPRYWVPEAEVEARLQGRWDRGWLLGWRDITNVTNERTVIAAVIPRVGVGDTMPLFLPREPRHPCGLLAVLNAFILDFIARQKVGGMHLTYNYLEQLPVLPPEVFDVPCSWSPGETLADWLRPRVLELTYTAWDLALFARDMGYDGPPFRWDEERRFRLRCELDACFFHLYLGSPEEWEREATPELKAFFPTPRDAVAYILDQFPIVRRKDEERYGRYRTKETILKRYDEMCR